METPSIAIRNANQTKDQNKEGSRDTNHQYTHVKN
jgi:hypothetical protein